MTVENFEVSSGVARRYRRTLIAGQVLAGLGIGYTITMGSLLATHIGGSESFAGLAAAMSTLGSAVAAIPLARAAARRGRRFALVTGASFASVGAGTTILSGGLMSIPVLIVGLMFIGVGNAVNMQARFAITDVSTPERRARDLSIVVWSTTAGAVLGPNLNAVGVVVGDSLGLPHNTGPFLFTLVAQFAASIVYFLGIPAGMMPHSEGKATRGRTDAPTSTRLAGLTIGVVALSHATMASVMSMTPVHLVHDGNSIAYTGFVVSLHVAGMYAFSPVFGWLADRVGRVPTIVVGQCILLVSLLLTWLDPGDAVAVTIGLFLLGLGWSASTVAGSTLVSESAPTKRRTVFQGRSDTLQSASGALAAIAAGPVMASMSYAGLSLAAISLVASSFLLIAVARLTRSRDS